MHFIPTGSSWLNQVERWFGHLTEQKIRRGTHKSVQALEANIRSWVKSWNDDPKPFVWKKPPTKSSTPPAATSSGSPDKAPETNLSSEFTTTVSQLH